MSQATMVILGQENFPSKRPCYCMGCSRVLFYINRPIMVVYIGGEYPEKEIPRGMGWVEIKCRGRIGNGVTVPCDMLYSFYFQ